MTTRDELMGNLPLQYFDGPDYCTVKDATGGDFALTVQPELLKEMEAALTASAPGEPLAWYSPTDSAQPFELHSLASSRPDAGGDVREALADWSDLPKDIYVIGAQRVNAVGYDVQCCSVPMVTVPEIRYVRADIAVNASAEARLREELREKCELVDNISPSEEIGVFDGSGQWIVLWTVDDLRALSAAGGEANICPQCKIRCADRIFLDDTRSFNICGDCWSANRHDGGGEAKKSIPVQDAESVSGAHVAGRTGGAHPPTGANPSDPTADVTVADVKSVLMKTCSQVWAYEAEKMARALLDAFTVGRR